MSEKRLKWLLLLPAVVVLASVTLGPLGYSIYISFFKWPKLPTHELKFTGVENFIQLFRDSAFLSSLKLTFKFVLTAVTLELLGGFILALALTKIKRFRGIIISYLLIPSMLPGVAVAVAWLLLLSYYYGPINHVLSVFLKVQPVLWLGSPVWSFWSIVFADFWQWTPFMTLLIFSALISLPVEPLEAAKVDGASPFQTLVYIVLPLIRPIVLVAIIIRTIDAFKNFELPLIMTGGGPGNATELLSLRMYRIGFKFWNLSYAAAVSIIFLVIISLIAMFYVRIIKAEELSV